MQLRFEQYLSKDIDRFRSSTASICKGQPAFSLSIKTSWENFAGKKEEVLLIAQIDETCENIPTMQDWAVLRMEPLLAFLNSPTADKTLFRDIISFSQLTKEGRPPGIWTLLHAAVRQRYTAFLQPAILSAVFCQPDSNTLLNTFCKNTIPVLPFSTDFSHLFCQVSELSQSQKGMVLANWGLLAAGDEPGECVENIIKFSGLFTGQAQHQADGRSSKIEPEDVLTLAKIRRRLSTAAGQPQVLANQPWHEYSNQPSLPAINEYLLKLPAHLAVTNFPMGVSETTPNPATRIVFGSPFGVVAAGTSKLEADFRLSVFSSLPTPLVQSSSVVNTPCLPSDEQQSAVSLLANNKRERRLFDGEVALVTGAASGIGKACVESLLARGSAVVGLDINPAIVETFHHPSFLGFECDITNEESVRTCIQETVCKFGGLDMLVLNAGLFPSGCNIEHLNMAEFSHVMDVNLNANVVFLREAFAFLRLAPRYGRVVFIGSKNVKAPGPGAAAYSASKAAVTQLARVAALEWGAEHVRVNVLHPDAVFDTGLYTEEVLHTRAEHYGISVDQYKTRNLLKTEVTSHLVGEMVAEMCGPLFSCITGTQIQMDAGNERTI